jgi:hypothetical protein
LLGPLGNLWVDFRDPTAAERAMVLVTVKYATSPRRLGALAWR